MQKAQSVEPKEEKTARQAEPDNEVVVGKVPNLAEIGFHVNRFTFTASTKPRRPSEEERQKMWVEKEAAAREQSAKAYSTYYPD